MNNAAWGAAIPWALCAILALTLTVVITLEAWGVHPWHGMVDYQRFGTWSTALSGLGSTSAVVLAFTAFCWERISQRKADTRQQVESQTAVFQWLTSKEIREDSERLIGRLWDLRIQNSTPAPIYRWKATFGEVDGHVCNAVKRPLLPAENVFNVPLLDNTEPGGAPEPTLFFETRASGVWKRSARGVLERATGGDLICSHNANANCPK